MTASVLTLTAISVERFAAIVFPLKARWTACTNAIIIAVTWLLAAAVASPHLFVRHMYEQHWKDRHEVWCAEEWPQVYKDEDCNTWEPGKVPADFFGGNGWVGRWGWGGGGGWLGVAVFECICVQT